MGKPSIFSREYEKKMKKRRRNIIIISLAIILVIAAMIAKVADNPIDYTNIKKNIQAWIDSDSMKETNQADANKDEATKQAVKEEQQKQEEETIDVHLFSGNTAKAVCINDTNNGKMFKSLENADDGVGYNISPSGKEMLVIDTNSVITLYNVDGTNKIISKDQYVSTRGEVFTKDSTTQAEAGYLWNSNPKFISDDKIVFVTNRPYFGAGVTKKYIWITNIQNGEDTVLWDMSGSNIEIGDKEEKGVKVTIDGRVNYIDSNGNAIQ